MARSYQSAAGYGRRCTSAVEPAGPKTKTFNRKDREELPQRSQRRKGKGDAIFFASFARSWRALRLKALKCG